MRQLCAQGKIPAACEIIESIIETGEKVLVFASFIDPLEKILTRFKNKAVMITGKTPVEDRGGIVRQFQTDGNVQIFLGGYNSAGVGISLTSATNFIAIDFPWNPSQLRQAIDRLHRPGQTANSVNIYQLSAINTIDDDMKDILDYKQGVFDRVIDGKMRQEVSDTLMNTVIKGVLKKY